MSSPAPITLRAMPACLAALALTIAVLVLPSTALAAPGWTASQALPESMISGAVTVSPKIEVDRAGNAQAVWAENAGGIPAAITIKAATKPVDGTWSTPASLIAESPPGTPLQGNYPALTVAPDGTATAVWQDNNTLASTGIWASTRPPGGSWGAPENISPTTPTTFSTAGPRVVTDRAGNTTVVWQVGVNVRAATRPAGGNWAPPVDVYLGDAADTAFLFGLAADVGPSGAVTVAFRVGKTNNMGIYAKTRATVGGDWSSLQEILGRGNTVNDLQLAVSGAGKSLNEATVLWRDNSLVVKTSSRAPAFKNESGTTWSTPATVGSGTVPKVRYDRHGNAIAVWQGSADIQTMRRAAGVWSAAATLPGTEAGSAPQLAPGPNAEVHVAWLASDGTAPVVQGARYAAGAWSAPVAVSDPGVTASAPALAAGPTGDVEAVWAIAGDSLRGATFQDVPQFGIDWTANGLPGWFDLRSWIDYINIEGERDNVLPSAGATRSDVNDPNSHRFTYADAWIQQETGETVVASSGQIRYNGSDHHIDIRILDPQFRIAADGLSGRVVSDGQGSGSMIEAKNGNAKVVPFQNLHLLDLDVDAGTKVVSADGQRTTWVGVPATVTADSAEHLAYKAGTAYGFFTITAPTSLPARSYPPIDAPVPDDKPKPKPKLLRATGHVTKTGRKGSTTVALSKRPGATANKAYRIKLVRKGKTIATGTVKGKTLKLKIRKIGKGKKTRYPKLKGAYTLTGAKGVKGVTKTQLTVRKPA